MISFTVILFNGSPSGTLKILFNLFKKGVVTLDGFNICYGWFLDVQKEMNYSFYFFTISTFL